MKAPLIDFGFLYDLAGNDASYLHEVIKLYLDTIPSGIEKLEQSIRETNDYEIIQKQSHFLKSSASVVKVRDMYDDLIEIEILAGQHAGKNEMIAKLDHLLANFKEALPLIIAEKEKYKLSRSKVTKK